MARRSDAARPLASFAGFALSVAALLSACGFHLQGRVPLPEPIRTPYVDSADRQSEFVQSLRRALLTSGAHPSDERDKASAVVSILKDQVSRRRRGRCRISLELLIETARAHFNLRFHSAAVTDVPVEIDLD